MLLLLLCIQTWLAPFIFLVMWSFKIESILKALRRRKIRWIDLLSFGTKFFDIWLSFLYKVKGADKMINSMYYIGVQRTLVLKVDIQIREKKNLMCVWIPSNCVYLKINQNQMEGIWQNSQSLTVSPIKVSPSTDEIRPMMSFKSGFPTKSTNFPSIFPNFSMCLTPENSRGESTRSSRRKKEGAGSITPWNLAWTKGRIVGAPLKHSLIICKSDKSPSCWPGSTKFAAESDHRDYEHEDGTREGIACVAAFGHLPFGLASICFDQPALSFVGPAKSSPRTSSRRFLYACLFHSHSICFQVER